MDQRELSSTGAENGWDKAIQETLSLDARSLPAFATTPNATLLSLLASEPVAKGLFASLGGKFALLLGSAAIVGSTVYFGSRSNSPEQSPRMTPVAMQREPTTKPALSSPIVQTDIKPAAPVSSKRPALVKTEAPKLKLDDVDRNNVPRYVNKNYNPPLK